MEATTGNRENMEKQQVNSDREEEEEDFFNVTIMRSGCAVEHYALQDCFADKGDWRKCGSEMKQFKMCMDKNKLKK